MLATEHDPEPLLSISSPTTVSTGINLNAVPAGNPHQGRNHRKPTGTQEDNTRIYFEIIGNKLWPGFNCLGIVPSEHGNESSTNCEKFLTTRVTISFSIKINLHKDR
jgi:hypothetical protein